ncbi:MAG: protein translocase subunit SecF [Dehalococcoidia bacterium]|nr:protein translocase subunit SecF [Dehalococcoidia bacterium]
MIDFVGKRYWYLIFSAILLVPGLISLMIPPALKPGIEFTSGALISIRFQENVDESHLREKLKDLGYGEVIIQKTSEGSFLMRTRVLGGEQRDESGNPTGTERQLLESGLREAFGPFEVLSFDAVSPIVAGEIVRNAALAVVAASVGIMLYIWFAFRQIPNSFRYGACAIIALLHDAVMLLGMFSIFGKVFGIEVDSLFITATLTVIGFSVHDTIVVFDRIRENVRRNPNKDFATNVNNSLIQTMGRSLATSLTLLFTSVALLLFGGVTIKTFVLAITVGLISGTYSSIFVASQLLVIWEYGELGRILGGLFGGGRTEPVSERG